jgi:hypothetical protein
MGSCRRDRHTASRNSAGPTTGGAASRLEAVDAGQERYSTDSKTAAKPRLDAEREFQTARDFYLTSGSVNGTSICVTTSTAVPLRRVGS